MRTFSQARKRCSWPFNVRFFDNRTDAVVLPEQRYNDSDQRERHGAFTATFSENLQTSLTPPSQA